MENFGEHFCTMIKHLGLELIYLNSQLDKERPLINLYLMRCPELKPMARIMVDNLPIQPLSDSEKDAIEDEIDFKRWIFMSFISITNMQDELGERLASGFSLQKIHNILLKNQTYWEFLFLVSS